VACTRRQFLGLAGAGILSAALPRTLLGAGIGRAPHGQPAGELRELRRGVGVYSARGGTIGWLANPETTVVVDSQYPDTARDFLEALRARGAQPVETLINTHHHSDHTAGNPVMGEGARRIVAHVRVPELQRAAADAAASAAAQRYADTTFEGELVLEAGGERVRLRHHGAAHTGGDAAVHFERANVVHLGDLVFNRAYPFIDRAGGASVRGWISFLESVAAETPRDAHYVFGHARAGFGVTGGCADVLLQRDLLSAVLELAERAVARGLSRAEATEPTSLPAFPQHAPLIERLSLGTAIGAAYDELTESSLSTLR
jgi:cyclase